MSKTAELLPGTLDMLILKAVSLKPLHGYGVLLRTIGFVRRSKGGRNRDGPSARLSYRRRSKAADPKTGSALRLCRSSGPSRRSFSTRA